METRTEIAKTKTEPAVVCETASEAMILGHSRCSGMGPQ